MILNYLHLDKLEYPVFVLESDNWQFLDGMLFLDGEVLDDKNMPGITLGQRRLQTSFKNLVKLKKGLFSSVGILKQPTYTSYIDNRGVLFTYEKTKMVPLKSHKIRKIVKKDTYSKVWVANYNFGFDVPRPPPPSHTWASVLHLNGLPWLLYEYSEEKHKDTNRKI